jgi:hypothetical protein
MNRSRARRLREQLDRAFAGIGLGALTLPSKIAIASVVAAAVLLAWGLFVVDTFSKDPSSTAPLVFPVFAFYVAIAVAVISAFDWAARRIGRRYRQRVARR